MLHFADNFVYWERAVLDVIQGLTFYLCYLVCRYAFAKRTYEPFIDAIGDDDFSYMAAFFIVYGCIYFVAFLVLYKIIPLILPKSFLALSLPPYFDGENVHKLLE